MEQARLLLAIGLSFLVLFVWSTFFVERQPINENQETEQLSEKTTDTIESDPIEQPKTSVIETAGQSDVQTAQPSEVERREITVENPFYTVRLSAQGATFTSYILKNYREAVETDAPNKELIPPALKRGVIRTSLSEKSLSGLDDAVFSVDYPGDRILVNDSKQTLDFSWTAPNGTVLTKRFTFDPNSYLIDLSVTIQNRTDKILSDRLVVSIRTPVLEDQGYAFVGPSALIDNKLEQIKIKKIEDKSEYNGIIKWIGVEDRYFISSIMPGNEIKGRMKLALEDDMVVNQLINPVFEIPSGAKQEYQFQIFMGPKSMALLDSLGHDLGKALNFGFFNFIAKPCLWFMNQIHSVIPNYGIAIILLTICTKILLWPLGNKSYKSMSEMKKLQPLMTEIREKYKNDKQKMNQELMALYRTYKVNPMGGCLPMVLQIPVFFALYRMLYQAIELRHAPFLLWINDLSAPDRLFNFGFSIPFMEPPYGIPVLTIIMGASMLLQQKMSPPPGDPTQAKMMMLMPIVFTFIFINFSSGLVLYWLVNNVLSISQQYYVQKKTA